MRLKIHSFDLHLHSTFQTSHSIRSVQKSIVVELHHKNKSGYGEATVNTYMDITEKKIIEQINLAKPIVEKHDWETPEELHSLLQPILNNNFALCAIDQAAYDLYGKSNSIHTREYLKISGKKTPLTNYTIGIGSISEMIDKIKANPWPIYKIKLGTKEDLKIIEQLRKHTNATFRVDANCGWTAFETIANSKVLQYLGVEFIEQPLPPNDIAGAERVFQESSLPIIADESCVTESDVEQCIDHFHGINIKLTKCGGITAAKRMITEAKKHKLKIMLGCMTESSVGISATAQLLPLAHYADLDGALLISNDPASGVSISSGKISYDLTTYGNGTTLQ